MGMRRFLEEKIQPSIVIRTSHPPGCFNGTNLPCKRPQRATVCNAGSHAREKRTQAPSYTIARKLFQFRLPKPAYKPYQELSRS